MVGGIVFTPLSFVFLMNSAALSKAAESPSFSLIGAQNNQRVAYANFVLHEFHYLTFTTSIAVSVKRSTQCGLACLNAPPCFSFNLAAFPDISGRLLCELLPSDKYNNSEKFLRNEIFHHFSIWSPCNNRPCLNNGRCIALYKQNDFVCECSEGRTGKHCESNVNECEGDPCLNGGTCNDITNGYNCSCRDGFTGNRCETNVNECEGDPCLNGGTCNDIINGYNCRCRDGFTGNQCETEVDVCASNPCLNNGTCINSRSGFNCSCLSAFYGIRCEAGITINSSIIQTNEFYLRTLGQFLGPAVGQRSNWSLCWRASSDGWSAATFHTACDGKKNTITIISKKPYVFGGFTDVPWESVTGFGISSQAFIFSLHNKEDLAPFKSMVAVQSQAIYSNVYFGPTFGVGWDIYIANNANSNNKSYSDFGESNSYSVPDDVQDQLTILAGSRNFTPDEIEVFFLTNQTLP